MTLAMIGVGAMGEAILAGLLASGWDAGDIAPVEANPERQAALHDRHGVTVVEMDEAVRRASAVLVAVKPHDVTPLLTRISPFLLDDCVVISIAAGLSVATLEGCLPQGQPVVRAMPNTAAMVGESMIALCAGTSTNSDQMGAAAAILSAVGRTVQVDEKHMDAVTALSGSGPAYVMYVAEAMIDAGVLLGLPRPLAGELVRQTLYGSARLLLDGGHPTQLKEAVTSPGGTTIAALRELDAHAVKAGITDAVEASFQRSRELGGLA